jgi:hypothetical protein
MGRLQIFDGGRVEASPLIWYHLLKPFHQLRHIDIRCLPITVLQHRSDIFRSPSSFHLHLHWSTMMILSMNMCHN